MAAPRPFRQQPMNQQPMMRCALWLGLLLAGSACGGGDTPPGAVASSDAPDTSSGAAASVSAQPSGGIGQKVLIYENVTFLVPETWRLMIRGGAAGLGDFAPRPGGRTAKPSLVVSTNSPGPIDQAAPKRCEDGPAASVDLVDSGFAPIGDRQAEFRLWVAACADGTTEDRRAWLLPTSKVLFLEEYHVPENVDVVTTARVG